MTRLATRLLAAALTAVPALCGAETVYVIDKLLVGIHAEKSLDSDIVKVVPTGTPLEVVERDGEAALIRDPDGVSGWVDTTYLMGEKPASMRVGELEEKTRELQADLASALARVQELEVSDTAGDTGDAAEGQPERLEELERRLSSARLKSGEMEAELRDARTLNRRLEAELDALEARPPRAEAAAAEIQDSSATADARLRDLLAQRPVQLLLLAALVMMVMAFGGGVYLMDYLHRRRHGGFRV